MQQDHHHHGGHAHSRGNGHGPDHGPDHGGHHHGDALAELLDLDAQVLSGLHAEIADWVAGHVRPGAELVVDLGAGTGAGVLALLDRLGGATAVAVDQSPGMLARLEANATARGLAGRVRALEADLDAGWPPVGPADLVWSTNAMHHMADPARVLADVRAALRPGGVLAVVELERFPTFLPGDDGVEQRCLDAIAELRAHDMPHLGADWGKALTEAGFTVRAERLFTVAEQFPGAGRYAQASLSRTREALAERLDAADLAALDELLDPHNPQSVLHRTDLVVRAARRAWIGA